MALAGRLKISMFLFLLLSHTFRYTVICECYCLLGVERLLIFLSRLLCDKSRILVADDVINE